MKINFIFSNQYNNVLLGEKYDFDWREIQLRITHMTKFWEVNGQNIIRIMQKILGIKFQEKSIVCYLNSKVSISDPLSLKIEDVKDMQDNLIHELIHILLTQNYNKNSTFKKAWDAFYKSKFQEESNLTRSHLIVHSVHEFITKKLYPTRLESIKKYSNNKDYLRSWQIVEKKGAQNIINFLLNNTD